MAPHTTKILELAVCTCFRRDKKSHGGESFTPVNNNISCPWLEMGNALYGNVWCKEVREMTPNVIQFVRVTCLKKAI